MRNLVGGLAISVCAAVAAPAKPVTIATSNPGSLLHNIATAVAKVANDRDIVTTVLPATSPNQFIPLVNAGEAEFGVGNLQEFLYAHEGTAWFAGTAHRQLRIIGMIMPIRQAIFVRAGSDIHSIADLRGKPMVSGFIAQQTILPQLEAHYGAFGLSADDMIDVPVASVVAGANAFMAGDSVGFIFAHGAGKVREAEAAVGGLRALPINNDERTQTAIAENWPTGFLVEISPGPEAPGVHESARFIAYPQLLFTHAEISDDLAYAMAQILYEDQAELAEIFAPFRMFKPMRDMIGDVAGAEYHPGAIKFLTEVGLW